VKKRFSVEAKQTDSPLPVFGGDAVSIVDGGERRVAGSEPFPDEPSAPGASQLETAVTKKIKKVFVGGFRHHRESSGRHPGKRENPLTPAGENLKSVLLVGDMNRSIRGGMEKEGAPG
jgi:hypothetical protein